MLGFFKRLFGPAECDHLYFPVMGDNGKPIGQECALCQKFNSISEN